MVAATAQAACGRELARGTAQCFHPTPRPGAPATLHASLASPSRRVRPSQPAVPALPPRQSTAARNARCSPLPRC